MKNLFSSKFFVPCLAVLAVGIFLYADPVFAQSTADTSNLIDMQDNPTGVSQSTVWGGSLRAAILAVINYCLFFLGVLTVAMVVYAGFLYITSGIEEKNNEAAKKILMYSAIGIVVILLSYAIANTLLNVGGGSTARSSTAVTTQ